MKLRLGDHVQELADTSDWTDEKYRYRYHVRRAWGLQLLNRVFIGVLLCDTELVAEKKKVRTIWPKKVEQTGEWRFY